jgi:hypothetical protein
MNRASIAGIATLIVLLVVAAVFSVAYLMPISPGQPSLRVELAPHLPWNAQTGQPIRFNITLANEASPSAAARNVRIVISIPENFTICGQRTSEYSLTIDTLRGREKKDNAFDLTALPTVSGQNYNVSIRVTADNAPEQTLLVPLKVTSTIYIP